jgi:hypothetical protein
MERQMNQLRKLALLAAMALAALALTAGSASAAIVDGTTQTAYDGPVAGTENGVPTLTSGTTVVRCTSADVTGTADGTASTADLSFSWASCDTSTLVPCTVDPISNVTTEAIPDGAGPNGELLNKEAASTTIICGVVFQCTAGATIDQVSAELDATANTATIADVVDISGAVACDAPATWNAVYTVTPTDLEVR